MPRAGRPTVGLRRFKGRLLKKPPLENPRKTFRTLKAKRAFVPFRFQLDFSRVIHNPDFSQRNPENRDKANPTASQRRFGIGHIRNSMRPHHSLAVLCIIRLFTVFNLRW